MKSLLLIPALLLVGCSTQNLDCFDEDHKDNVLKLASDLVIEQIPEDELDELLANLRMDVNAARKVSLDEQAGLAYCTANVQFYYEGKPTLQQTMDYSIHKTEKSDEYWYEVQLY